MDPRLFKVSWTGSVPSLQSLLETDPFILYDVVLTSSNTPLHIACMPGHLNFVKEILKLRPEFAGELNQDGYSPLHIASANGHAEIVRELLNMNQNFSVIVGREGRIPLHNAVVKGKLNVVTQLLAASVDSIELTTAQGETALHLAVRNNQFTAFKLLLDHAKQFNKEGVLTKKDNQGNTILHLADSKKQYEVVELLLNGGLFSQEQPLLGSNGRLGRGVKPLDVLQLFQTDAGYREIEEILKRAAALKSPNQASKIPESSVTVSFTSNELATNQTQTQRSTERFWTIGHVEKTPPDVRNTLLVVAILIAAATYQALLTPPGGQIQDGDKAGKSILAMNNSVAYIVFLVFNSLGFYISVSLIYFLTTIFPFRPELYIGMTGMVATYDACMFQLAPTSSLHAFTIFVCLFPVIIQFAMIYIRKCWRSCSS